MDAPRKITQRKTVSKHKGADNHSRGTCSTTDEMNTPVPYLTDRLKAWFRRQNGLQQKLANVGLSLTTVFKITESAQPTITFKTVEPP